MGIREATLRPAVLGLIAMTLAAATAHAEPPAALKPFEFLLGEWEASGAGQPGAATGRAVFSRGLQDSVILRKSQAEYPASEGRPASRHEDLIIVYGASGGGARADYYDSEGHAIRYVLSSPAAGEALFLSETMRGEPRYRLRYKLGTDGLLRGEFAIAPPADPEGFKPYLAWDSRRKAGEAK